jgi:putative nucleotidyltransferase with HDIG domain
MEKNKLILIIDDDEDFRILLKKDLRTLGYKIIEATDAASGREVLEMNRISLIITDVKMPKMNGLDFYMSIKDKFKVPVILMTGLQKILETKEAHDIGLKHFLTKPYKKTELSRLINEVTEAPNELLSVEKLEDKYKSVPLVDIEMQLSFTYALYVKLSSLKFVKISHSGTHLDKDRISKLKEKNIDKLYITKQDFDTYVKIRITVAHHMEVKTDVSPEEKKKFMIKTGELVVDKIFTEVVDEHTYDDAKEYLEMTLDLITNDSDILDLLREMQNKGDAFYAHQLSVSLLSVQLAKFMQNQSDQTMFLLGLGGIFHDIGKKQMPIESINKMPDELEGEQRQLYDDHPINGTEILNKYHKYPSGLLQIVMQHHENCLGTGFPFKLKKPMIFPLARFIHVIDEFCHLVFPYNGKKALTPKVAIEVMKQNNKGELDEEVFEGLVQLFS